MIMKWRNQKEIPTPKNEVGNTKLTIRYLYQQNNSKAESENLFPNRRQPSYQNLTKNMKTHKRRKHNKIQQQSINNKNIQRSIALERTVIKNHWRA